VARALRATFERHPLRGRICGMRALQHAGKNNRRL
jgi:hypothetical protein